ncbi:MAG: hypothetical protein F6K09_40100 [Merismopedia sp. SIO2A8]|nr:hypothetical protein [Merismopedia sp. SIO2A8]
MIHQGHVDKAQWLKGLAVQINQSWIRTPLMSQRVSPDHPSNHPVAASPSTSMTHGDRQTPAPIPPIQNSLRSGSITQDLSHPCSNGSRHTSYANHSAVSISSPPIFSPSTQHPKPSNVAERNAIPNSPTSSVSSGADPIPHPKDTTPLPKAPNLNVSQQITDSLADISQLLQQLRETLAAQTQVIQSLADQLKQSPTSGSAGYGANPLWYMDVLERACDRHWVLTTDEIEQLIGVKPKCHGTETTYQRGGWVFAKTGKLGSQTAWRVGKDHHNDESLQ